MLNIVELLKMRGLDTTAKVKLIRHQDARCDVDELYRRGQLETYQRYQRAEVFNCDYVVSFIGISGTRARFIGVFEVRSSRPCSEVRLPKDFIYPDMDISTCRFFDLDEVPGFEDLKDRVIIEWGKGTLSWHQRLREKEVVEILPTGYVKEFPGYLELVVDYHELRIIVENPLANKIWHTMLSGVAGVYTEDAGS